MAHGKIILHHSWKKQALQYKYITSREGLQRSELGFTTLSRKRTQLEILIQSTTLGGDYIVGGKSKHYNTGTSPHTRVQMNLARTTNSKHNSRWRLHCRWKDQTLQYGYISSREGLQKSKSGFTSLRRKGASLKPLSWVQLRTILASFPEGAMWPLRSCLGA